MKRPSPPRLPRGSGPSQAAFYKARQRARIAEEHGIEELRRRRSEEKFYQRLVQYFPMFRDNTLFVSIPERATSVKPRRLDHPFYAIVTTPKNRYRWEKATGRLFDRVACGIGFNDLTTGEQCLYAKYLWLRTWEFSHVVTMSRKGHPREFWRRVRRRLLRLATVVTRDPSTAVRRLIRIGLMVPREDLALPGARQAVSDLTVIYGPFYCHLRASGVELPDVERRYPDDGSLMGSVLGSPLNHRQAFSLLALLNGRNAYRLVQGIPEADVLAMAEARTNNLTIVSPSVESVNVTHPTTTTTPRLNGGHLRAVK